ncbi:helix-turn-helix domain-containing protein [bacterium]|nr:helix-turn-helix domain-containing protein [bacterium]
MLSSRSDLLAGKKTMKCLQCGHLTTAKKRNRYHFTECGLRNIYLNGISEFGCARCGEIEVVIPNIDQLQGLIAREVALLEARLKPEEIRFLRVHLGFSGADFARKISVEPETVSRWENGKSEMKLTFERFLRLMILSNAGPFREYDRMELFGSTDEKGRPRRNFTVRADHWGPGAA